MLTTKTKEITKAGITNQSVSEVKSSGISVGNCMKSKNSIKDYVDEIFAGLIWLG